MYCAGLARLILTQHLILNIYYCPHFGLRDNDRFVPYSETTKRKIGFRPKQGPVHEISTAKYLLVSCIFTDPRTETSKRVTAVVRSEMPKVVYFGNPQELLFNIRQLFTLVIHVNVVMHFDVRKISQFRVFFQQ